MSTSPFRDLTSTQEAALRDLPPIQQDPNHQFNSIADTTLEQAQANTLYAVKAEVAKLNAARVAEYEAQFIRYAAAMDARPDATNVIAPMPANGVAVWIDPAGWPYMVPVATRVCPAKLWVPPATLPSSGGFRPSAPLLGLTEGELLASKVYGEPLQYQGMRFLRIL